jgi:hypothetical protein
MSSNNKRSLPPPLLPPNYSLAIIFLSISIALLLLTHWKKTHHVLWGKRSSSSGIDDDLEEIIHIERNNTIKFKYSSILTAGLKPMIINTPEISTSWRLYPIPPRYLTEKELLVKPFCSKWNSHQCHVWLIAKEQFKERFRAREMERKLMYTNKKHRKCPSSSKDMVTILLHKWNSGWDEVLNTALHVEDCPQKCQGVVLTTNYKNDISVMIDTYMVSNTALDLGGQPPSHIQHGNNILSWFFTGSSSSKKLIEPSVIRGLLELEDQQHMECPRYCREFSLSNTELLFSWSRVSNIWINYFYAWNHFPNPNCKDHLFQARHQQHSILDHFDACLLPVPTLDELKQNSKDFIVAFVSNCGNPIDVDHPGTIRAKYLGELLQELTRLTSNNNKRRVMNYGNCHRTPNIGEEPVGGKELIMPKFKFSLSFENTLRPDYVTEKLLQSVVYGTLPVVFGPPETGQFLPGGDGSYISVLDFDSPQHLAKFLVELDQDHARYLEYFKWRKQEDAINGEFVSALGFSFVRPGKESFICRACVVYAKEFCGIHHEEVMMV